ncbi:MAG: SDR family NAD(P)-dependent oxidoreductase [Actinomycetes bacterium]|jgi:NADP-dependent 3-hydroxy acid dehydrogenase YdfG
MTDRGYAVITGASSGIGAASARALANEGFHVIAAARRTEMLTKLAKENSLIEPWELDVTDQASVDALAAHLEGKRVTVLLANAGGAFDGTAISDADIESWIKAYDVNVIGALRSIKAIIPALIKSGEGTIVLMGSTAGRIVYENGGSYTAAKHAVAALAETLRLELAGEPVRVVELAPGMVKTDEFAVKRFGGDKERAAKIYEGVAEPLTADDVAEAVRWSVMLPHHFNIDLMVIRPLAQAAQHKVVRKL